LELALRDLDLATGDDALETKQAVKALLTRLHDKAPPKKTGLALDPHLWPRVAGAPELIRGVDEWGMGQFEWALFMLQHDVAPAVYAIGTGMWDTHQYNDALQTASITRFVQGLRWFLDELAATPRASGASLLDEVGILVCSEFGRFPYHNRQAGKDHFPIFPALLMGPGLRPGQFGQTNAELIGVNVDRSTGRPGGGKQMQLTLDDLGRTVLEWVGYPGAADIGYTGNVMEFCLA
jgi:uncharacterized protein (DUF1501 family)